MSTALEKIVSHQREVLSELLAAPMAKLASQIASTMCEKEKIESELAKSCPELRYSKYMYVMDADGVQCTANLKHDGKDESRLGIDRSQRPYMQGMFGDTDFQLSDAYISRVKKRPSLTAIQTIRDPSGKRVGFLGVDYDLRELPHPTKLYNETQQWRQIKGDPAIRGSLFLQKRTQSLMDERMDDVFGLMTELMQQHGVFHGKLHFSSSRATIWLADDPYNYRLLPVEDLTDPDTCLAYPRRNYFDKATVPAEMITPVLERFRELRFGDDVIYLRAGSLNIVNGMVGLNFSCDGSHYMHYDEFLNKGLEFWFGKAGCGIDTVSDPEIGHHLEEIGREGCEYTRNVIEQLDNDQPVPGISRLNAEQRDLLLDELKTIMAVYDEQ